MPHYNNSPVDCHADWFRKVYGSGQPASYPNGTWQKDRAMQICPSRFSPPRSGERHSSYMECSFRGHSLPSTASPRIDQGFSFRLTPRTSNGRRVPLTWRTRSTPCEERRVRQDKVFSKENDLFHVRSRFLDPNRINGSK